MTDPNANNAEPPLVTRVEVPTAPQKPRPGWFGAIFWCAVFLGTQLGAAIAMMCVVLGVYAIQSDAPGQFLDDQLKGLGDATKASAPPEGRPAVPIEIGQSLAYGMLAAQFASLALILLVVPRVVGRDWKRQVGVRRPLLLHVGLIVLLIPGFMVLPNLIQELFTQATGLKPPATVEALNGVFRQVPWFITFLAVGLGPGLVEEVWCRGFLGRGLCARYGLIIGVALTSLLFAILHMDPSQVLVITFMGAYLHFVYLASRSIWVPILLHTLNNSIAVLATLAGVVLQLNANPQGLTPVVYLTAFALLLFASFALWTGRAVLEPVPGVQTVSAWQPEYPGISAPPSVAASGVRIGYAPVSPAAVVLTLVSFAAMIYLLTR